MKILSKENMISYAYKLQLFKKVTLGWREDSKTHFACGRSEFIL